MTVLNLYRFRLQYYLLKTLINLTVNENKEFFFTRVILLSIFKCGSFELIKQAIKS